MARRVILSDDFTGEESEDVSTITFSLEGKYYEMDLSEKSYGGLEAALKRYIGKAREITPAQAIARFRENTDSETNAMREWARANGFEIGDRGRISDEIKTKYQAAVQQMINTASVSPTGNVTSSNDAGKSE